MDEETRFARSVRLAKEIEPIANVVGAIATLLLTIVLGATSYYQGKRQEELFERQVQIEDAAADPAFTYIQPQMLGRSSADLFALYKPTGSALDLHLNPYDCVVLEVSADDRLFAIERPVVDFEIRVRGRFDTSVSYADGVYITVNASQDYEPLEIDLILLLRNLEDKGLHAEIVTPLQSMSVLEMQYMKQTGEIVNEVFVLDATTGQQLSRYSSIDENNAQMLFASEFLYLDSDWDTDSAGNFTEGSVDKQNPIDVSQQIYAIMCGKKTNENSQKGR